MNTTDKLVTALTPGSIFNRNGLIFRSVGSLAEFAGMEENEVLELLNGDMAQIVTCKPSKKGKGILVALTDQIPAAGGFDGVAGPVNIAAGPVGPDVPIPDDGGLVQDEEVAADVPLDDAPAEDAEEVVA